MALDLTPKTAETLLEGEGGGYYNWTSSQMPLLAKNNLCAGRLVLHPQGFALPHYADASKLGIVLQGNGGVAGLVTLNSGKEVVVKLEKGDIIPVPLASFSWWFNNGDTDIIIIFLGETTKALIPGEISYFFPTGLQGLIRGISNELTSKAYNLTQEEVHKLTKSQTEPMMVKLTKDKSMPKPQIEHTKELVFNVDGPNIHNVVKNGTLITTLTEATFPFLGEVGLSVIRVTLEANAIKAPAYPSNVVAQLMYIARGSGKIEIVGLNGENILNTEVEAGQLIVVPQFYVVAQIAGKAGLESYSIVRTTKPMIEELGGRASIWGVLSPVVIETALNVDSEFLKLFLSKFKDTTN
ncbi:hypothetical protein TanjilG_24297 [Lupinus angustifolius]|uniref:Cupin type-1 domain-containing protein n=1 Tax=Lupinus angustifolius TaxID=3871 RepID=A0A1J7GJA9_LUPAN|nr:PREDICTED: glutelin type-A 2-like [Lupinus angustifolius]OIW00567.1 hypothetical protein TanjilG_24297 [Lupinus angustifolius]